MSSSTLKCNVYSIINKLLAYIQNKISVSDEKSLVKICLSSFSKEKINISNKLSLESLPSDIWIRYDPFNRKGKDKENRILCDIINVFKRNDSNTYQYLLPLRWQSATYIGTVDNLDVGKLLRDLAAVLEQLENIVKDFRETTPLSPLFSDAKINMIKGAYLNSGPIGLSNMHDEVHG